MTDAVTFTVDGKVVPWARAGRKGGFSFTPAHVRKYQDWVKICASQAMQGRNPLEGPVLLRLGFWMPIPDSWPAWKKEAAKQGKVRPTARPDLDNLVKGIKDACNLIVWKDDAQVVDSAESKLFGQKPMTEISVEPVSVISSNDEWKRHNLVAKLVPVPGDDLFGNAA